MDYLRIVDGPTRMRKKHVFCFVLFDFVLITPHAEARDLQCEVVLQWLLAGDTLFGSILSQVASAVPDWRIPDKSVQFSSSASNICLVHAIPDQRMSLLTTAANSRYACAIPEQLMQFQIGTLQFLTGASNFLLASFEHSNIQSKPTLNTQILKHFKMDSPI